MAARKTTRKKPARKKTTRKKAARKKTAAKKKTTRKKATRKKATRKKRTTSLLGDDLPRSLKAFGAQVRRELNAIERQIETSGRQARRSLARVVRDASHQLGVLETRGQKQWRSMSAKAQRDAKATLRRVQRATAGK